MAVSAVTQLSDLDFQTQAFADTMAGEFFNRVDALTSGVIAPVPAGLIPAGSSGQFMNAPQWDTLDYTGTSVISATASAPTPGVNGTWKTYAPYIPLEQAWGSDFLNLVHAALDPAAEVARQVGRWAAEVVSYVSAQATVGAMTTALNSSHTTGVTFDGATITTDAGITARALLYDNQAELTRCVMHGKVMGDAVRDKILETLANSTGATSGYDEGIIRMFLGAQVGMSDIFCAAVSSIYPTYFAAPGSVVFHSTPIAQSSVSNGAIDNISAGGINVQIERFRTLDRGGSDIITARLNIAAAVKGMEYQTTAPTAITDLATGANWAKSTNCDNKLVKIVRVTTL